MQPSDEFLDQWEHIIAGVNKTDIPLECIKKVVLKLKNNRQKTINLHTLKRQGLSLEEIETIMTRTLTELDADILDMDFVVDINSVVSLIQPETDKLLGKL
jgi:hypothetical protein